MMGIPRRSPAASAGTPWCSCPGSPSTKEDSDLVVTQTSFDDVTVSTPTIPVIPLTLMRPRNEARVPVPTWRCVKRWWATIRTLSALQAAVKALPTAPNGLRRCFGWSPPMTRPSPTPGSGGWPPGITPYRRCGRWRPTRLAHRPRSAGGAGAPRRLEIPVSHRLHQPDDHDADTPLWPTSRR